MTKRKPAREVKFRPKEGETKYPWKKWFDGKKHTITKGKEFKCTLRSMTVYLYTKAKELGKTVEVLEVEDGVLEIKSKDIPAKGRKSA